MFAQQFPKIFFKRRTTRVTRILLENYKESCVFAVEFGEYKILVHVFAGACSVQLVHNTQNRQPS